MAILFVSKQGKSVPVPSNHFPCTKQRSDVLVRLFLIANVVFCRYAYPVSESEKKENAPSTLPSAPLLGQEGRKPPIDFSAWQLAFELGYTVAIPIVLLALLGRFADKQFGSSPWLLLIGIVVSLFITPFLVYRKVTKLF